MTMAKINISQYCRAREHLVQFARIIAANKVDEFIEFNLLLEQANPEREKFDFSQLNRKQLEKLLELMASP